MSTIAFVLTLAALALLSATLIFTIVEFRFRKTDPTHSRRLLDLVRRKRTL